MLSAIAITIFFTAVGLIAVATVGHSVITGIARGRAILRELAALDAATRLAAPALRSAQPARRPVCRQVVNANSRRVLAISQPVRAAA